MPAVLVHPVHGIFLGEALGMGFWSKEDPAGQTAAPTFLDAEFEEIRKAFKVPEGTRFHHVVPDDGTYASVAACAAAGLEP